MDELPATDERPPRCDAEPHAQSLLSAALFWLAGLLALEGVSCVLYAYWGSLAVWVQAVLVALPPLLLWGVYMRARRRGQSPGRMAGVLVCLSWGALLLILHFCVAELPLPLLGLLFLLGAASVPLVSPAAVSFIIAAVATLAAFGALVFTLGMQQPQEGGFPWVQVWGYALVAPAIWAQAGAWCRLTARPGYAAYGFVAPLAWALFLMLWAGGLIGAQCLHAAGAGELLSCSRVNMVAIILCWLAPLALLPLLHLRWARHTGRPAATATAIGFWVAHALAAPLGCVAMAHAWALPLAGLLLVGYGVAMGLYGSVYACPHMAPTGCVIAFAPTVCLLFSGALGPAACGGLFLALAIAAVGVGYRLRRRYQEKLARVQLARQRQQQQQSR